MLIITINNLNLVVLEQLLPEVFRKIVLIIIPSIILLFLMFSIMARADMQNGFTVGVCFIIGGGIGTMIDRILYNNYCENTLLLLV